MTFLARLTRPHHTSAGMLTVQRGRVVLHSETTDHGHRQVTLLDRQGHPVVRITQQPTGAAAVLIEATGPVLPCDRTGDPAAHPGVILHGSVDHPVRLLTDPSTGHLTVADGCAEGTLRFRGALLLATNGSLLAEVTAAGSGWVCASELTAVTSAC